MGSLVINTSQLAEIQRMQQQIGNGVTVADVWSKLASYGDSYASSAASVIGDPGSMPWTIVRSIWNTTGADFGKFDSVALKHLTNYINQIGASASTAVPGAYDLPTTDFIEKSQIPPAKPVA